MPELDTILAVIDADEESQPALKKASQLARYAGSSVSLLSSEYSQYLDDGYYFEPVQARKLRQEHKEQRISELEEMAKSLRDEGIEVSTSAAFGNPAYAQVIGRAREIDAAMVVKATRHHSKTARLFLSNEDWELIRYCPSLLLLSRDIPWQNNPKIIAAVDPEHLRDKPATLDNKIVESAKSLVAISGGELHLFHSMHMPALSGLYPIEAKAMDRREKLRALASSHGVDESNCHVTEEDVAGGLSALVEELGASVVLMGAVSRSSLDRLLIGNTAERVLDQLDCDVMVVKPDKMPAGSATLI